MPGASLLENSQPPAPQGGSRVSFVDLDSAAKVILDLLSGLEVEGGPKHPGMLYAQIQAEKQLRAWGVTR